MTKAETQHEIVVAVLGNPNTGKSTLFNALTGVRQQTGNFPGVTVARKTGHFRFESQSYALVDLPGCYSLAAYSQEEQLTIDALLGQGLFEQSPEVVLCVVDADNLERNLFLVSQILELQLPTVIALNMSDVARRHGKEIDATQLAQQLNVPVIPIQANRGHGFEALKTALREASQSANVHRHQPFDESLASQIQSLESLLEPDRSSKQFVATRLLFDIDNQPTNEFEQRLPSTFRDQLKLIRQQRKDATPQSEADARYQWIRTQLKRVVSQRDSSMRRSLTDRLDFWLTHPVWGLLVATVLLVVLFQLVFWVAEPASAMIDTFNSVSASVVDQIIPTGAFNSLLKDGLINGVGSVLVFLPQILLLFLILGMLEDSGYLARAAFLMDRYLSRIGLSGITMFPLLSSFACAIPGIMATKVIRNERERLVTILIAPLMSCSARLPVYVLMIALFVPDRSYLGGLLNLQGLVMFAMYLLGVVTAIAVAWILKKTILKFGTTSFVLELPTYKMPGLINVTRRMFDGGWAFVRDAGTMIVAVTIIVWAIAYFPRLDLDQLPPPLLADAQAIESATDLESDVAKAAQNRIDAYQLEQSYLGRFGHAIEPVVQPLGWDWRIGSAVLASFPAREVIVSTLGVIFGLGADVDEGSDSLRSSIQAARWPETDNPLFTLPVAWSIMVFFALCAQCVSTLAVIRRETNSYRWPLFTFAYMTILAYIGAFLAFHIAQFLS